MTRRKHASLFARWHFCGMFTNLDGTTIVVLETSDPRMMCMGGLSE